MKNKYLSLAVLGLMAVASCTNESALVENSIKRVSAQLPEFVEEDGTRSQINVSEQDKISFRWAVGDVLGVIPDQGAQSFFTLTESSISADGLRATFDGGAWALKNGHRYYSYFPFSYENSTANTSLDAIPLDYTGQAASSWGSTENAGQYDFCAVTGGTTSYNGELSFDFNRVGSLLRLKFVLPATDNYLAVRLWADDEVIPVKGTVSLTSPTYYTPTTYASSLTVQLKSLAGTEGETVYVYMMLPPMDLLTQGKQLKATLCYSGNKEKTYKLCKSGTIEAHTPDFKPDYIYKRDAVLASSIGVLDGYEYVDLGLPSGTLWATANVGAENAWDYGKMFSWGETSRYLSDDKFRWDGYKYAKNVNNAYWMTKYCWHETEGVVADHKHELDLEDDAAYKNLSNKWCMPSIAQFDELVSNCYWVWTDSYKGHQGAPGRIVYKRLSQDTTLPTEENNQTSSCPQDYDLSCTHIFLLAQGHYDNYNGWNENVGGYYWSRSLFPTDADRDVRALLLLFNNEKIYAGMENVFRYVGQPVRPVVRQ